MSEAELIDISNRAARHVAELRKTWIYVQRIRADLAEWVEEDGKDASEIERDVERLVNLARHKEPE